MLCRERDLHLDLVARPRSPRPRTSGLSVKPEADASRLKYFRDTAKKSPRSSAGQLLGRKVPRRRREGEPLAALGDGDRRVASSGRSSRPERRPGCACPCTGPARTRTSSSVPRSRPHVLAGAERALLLQVPDERVDDLGGRPRRLPLVHLLVEEQPLHQTVAARVRRIELHERAQRERLRLDRVVVPEPGAVLRRPVRAEVAVGLRGIHHARPHQRRVLRAARRASASARADPSCTASAASSA